MKNNQIFDECNLLGFKIFKDDLKLLVSHALAKTGTSVINTLNPHSFVTQRDDQEFRSALMASDFLLPDGIGICLAEKVINNGSMTRISGFELFSEVSKQLNDIDGKVLFLGSTPRVLDKIRKRMEADFSHVTVEIFSPPFKKSFEDHDIQVFREEISKFKPDVIFVGLTAPKQEKLIAQLGHCSGVKIMCGIGAVFDFYSGVVQRPSKFWRRLHLEWFIRFLSEPRRLFGRNFISTPLFLIYILKEKFIN
ncbi:MAG: WecB/TagA/CpsF family glycosyltransferase [Paracoccaceae bacterium]|jgi:N-acetylglucosaminyldiphosphoundecaprenol N-acetyl-beta-D-mannosaminyltransferase